MKFREGDIVMCIDASGLSNVRQGQIYVVGEPWGSFPHLVYLPDAVSLLLKRRFVKVGVL